MAEGIMRELVKKRNMDIEVDSAGVLSTPGTPASKLAKEVLAEMGIDIHDKTSKLISYSMIEKSDLILVMTERHKQFFKQFKGKKVYTIGEFIGTNEEICDPFGGTKKTYGDTAYQLYKTLEKVLDKISGKTDDAISNTLINNIDTFEKLKKKLAEGRND